MTPSSSTTTSPPPGWYADPQFPNRQRWWDGVQWTAQTSPVMPAGVGARVGAAKAARALVFAIVGLVLFAPLSVAAVVMGARARAEGKRIGRPVDGRMNAAFVVGIVGVSFWGLVVAIAIAGGSSTTTSSEQATTGSSSTSSAPAAQPASTPAKAATPQEEPVAKEEPEMTSAQENALESAHSYVDMSGFSKKGLINQLSSSAGEGFSKADAKFAANNVGADWKQEALESAQSYIDMSGFSKQGLIEQLSSSTGEGFTRAEATYAVNNVGADWNEEAVESAQSYLDMGGFSEQALIEQLSSSAGEGFTPAQARHAVNEVY